MKILFVVSVISFFVLAWAAFSVARHVRGHAALAPEPAVPVQVRRVKASSKARRRANRKPVRIAA